MLAKRQTKDEEVSKLITSIWNYQLDKQLNHMDLQKFHTLTAAAKADSGVFLS